MKYLPLLLRSLLRHKVRTALTMLSIAVAFLLFGLLAALETAFGMGVEVAGADRLVTIHKVSLIQLLPISYADEIRRVPGVTDVCHQTFFGGKYQDSSHFFMQMPVDAACELRVYPEFRLPEEQKKAWLADRQGVIVGRATADYFGWKVGQRIPMQATIWRKKDNSTTWEFNIDGIYEGAEKGTDTSLFLFHYDYFEESRLFGQGQIGWYVIRVADPAKAAEVAQRIDALFANSPAETKTTTEKAFAQAFAKQVGDIGFIVRSIMGAVFFTILLVAGNTMAQSVRERTSELAVLKTLGFTDARVLVLVLVESCAIAGIGGGLGLGLAYLATAAGDPTKGMLPSFYIPVPQFAIGIALVGTLGIVTGIFPALRAMRLRIVDALRRV